MCDILNVEFQNNSILCNDSKETELGKCLVGPFCENTPTRREMLLTRHSWNGCEQSIKLGNGECFVAIECCNCWEHITCFIEQMKKHIKRMVSCLLKCIHCNKQIQCVVLVNSRVSRSVHLVFILQLSFVWSPPLSCQPN